jgi:MYXO-CTERM domain-containing protein
VNNGDTIAVRHTSAATNDTDTDTTLTVGGIADTFTSTTERGSTGFREDDGGSSLDALMLALLGLGAFLRRRVTR